MRLYIVRLNSEQVEEAYNIIKECGQDMQKQFGLTHWNPTYPIEEMRDHAREKEVYAVREKNTEKMMVATFTIDTQYTSQHVRNLWFNTANKALYLSKLAVLPKHQGKGIGSWCMKEIEELAKLKEASVIRLYALLEHRSLIRFYHCKLGYNICGIVKEKDCWQENKEWLLAVFEKLI